MQNESGAPSIWSDIAGEALGHVRALPTWSLAAHLVVGAAVLALQQILRGTRQFSSWNEFLCTLLWVCWTLETFVIGFASSIHHAHFALFLRLLLWPLLSHDACVNPLNTVFIAVQHRSPRLLPRCLAIQLVAMAMGLGYSALVWWVLGSWLSSATHLDFLSNQFTPFLTVGLVEGFLLELSMSFTMFLPRLVMRNDFSCTFVSAVLTCVMVLYLEHTTGAFMNPLVALSCSLLLQPSSLSLAGVWEMALVYWMGPFLGTVLVARLDMWLSSHKKLHSS